MRCFLAAALLFAIGCSGEPRSTLFVDRSAVSGGDGSLADPFKTVGEALGALSTSVEMLAIAPGDYQVPKSWSFATSLIFQGSIQGTTRIFAAQGAPRIEWILPEVGSLVVRDLQFSSALLARKGDLELQNFSMSGAQGAGIEVVDATARFYDVRVAEVRDGDGVVVRGGSLLWEGGGTSEVSDRGLYVVGATATATVSDLALASDRRGSLSVEEGASVLAEALTIEDVSIGVSVSDSTLKLSKSRIERASILGMLVVRASDIEVLDSTFRDCPGGHLSSIGAGTKGLIRGNLFSGALDTPCLSVGDSEAGIIIENNTVEGCATTGISLSHVSNVEVRGNEIKDVVPTEAFPDLASGLTAIDSRVSLTDNHIYDCDEIGVTALRSALTILGNTLGPLGSAGVSLVDPGPARSIITMNTVDAATGAGLLIMGTAADVRKNTIVNTKFDAQDGFGHGVAFGAGADVSVVNNVIKKNSQSGIVFVDGARGEIRGNTLVDNAQYGILELCTGAANTVGIGSNILSGNGVQAQNLCTP